MLNESQLFKVFGFYEESRFVYIDHGFYYTCLHQSPTSFDFNIPTEPPCHSEEIELNKILSPEGVIGYAGKCETCGKVYYR